MAPTRAAVLGALALGVTPARAYEARVSASHAAQFYGVESPFGSPELLRRRHSSTLGLELVDLTGLGERGPRLEFTARLRLDADFGQHAAERDPASARFVPGLEQAPLDVSSAYFELASGAAELRLGRQLVIDGLGFWLFDGARLALRLPLGLEVGALAGVEPRPGLPLLVTQRYVADGVQRGNRDALGDDAEPSFLRESRLAPAAAAWLALHELGPLSASVVYRRIENRSPARLTLFPRDPSEAPRVFTGSRTSSERLATSARLDWTGTASAHGTAVYDLYRALWSELSATVEAVPAPELRASAELERRRPTFDADSIFNWFEQGRTGRALAHLDYLPLRTLDASLSWGVHWFETEADPFARPEADAERDRSGPSLVGRLAARLRAAPAEVSLALGAEAGERGHSSGLDLGVSAAPAGGAYDWLALLSLYDWSDPLRRERDATSFTYVLGAGLPTGSLLFSRGRAGIEWEHTLNRLVAQRFRVLVRLELEVFR